MKHSKLLTWVIVGGLLTGTAAALIINKNDQTKTSGSDASSSTSNPSANEGRVTEQQARGNAGSANPQTTPTTPKKTINPTITSLDQTSDTVTVRAILNASSGTCTLRFSKTGQANVEASAPVGAGPTYYICQGFDIAKTRFPVGGEWQATVYYSSVEAEGKSETKSLTINWYEEIAPYF